MDGLKMEWFGRMAGGDCVEFARVCGIGFAGIFLPGTGGAW